MSYYTPHVSDSYDITFEQLTQSPSGKRPINSSAPKTSQKYRSRSAEGDSRANLSAKPLSDTLKPLLLQSTAHGIPRAARGPSIFRRIFWIVIFIICFLSFIVQTGFLCARFFSFPVNTKLSVRTRKNVTWPAVTVCNLNKFAKSLIDNVDSLQNLNGMIFQSAVDLMYQEYQECREDEEMYDCGNNECGFIFWKCDGYYDCDSNLDERNEDCCDDIERNYESNMADHDYEATLDELRFQCTNSTGYCVHGKLRCNGVVDCPDGSDEQGCNGLQQKMDARPWLQAYKEGKKEDYSDLQAAGTTGPETVRKNGQQIEDFITQCSFDSLTCEVDDFYTWQNDVYGNCFTFNHIKKPTKTTVREGSQYGLKLALFVDQDDYVGLLSPASGVRVSIHSRNIKPFPEDDGFSVSPGTATSIRIHEKKFVRLGHPYGDCTENIWPGTVQSTSAQEFHYSTKSCNKFCFAEYTFHKCGCLSSLILAETNKTANRQFCTIENTTQKDCQEEALADYSQGKLNCGCKVPCEEARYQTTLSSARWPEGSYLWHFVRMLYRETGKKIKQFTGDVRHNLVNRTFTREAGDQALIDVRENFVKLEIYFDDLSLEEIYEEKQLSVETFLSSIGGSLGLWVGLSIISLVEAFEVAYYMLRWWCKRTLTQKELLRSNDPYSRRPRNMGSSIQANSMAYAPEFNYMTPLGFSENRQLRPMERTTKDNPMRTPTGQYLSAPVNGNLHFLGEGSPKVGQGSETPHKYSFDSHRPINGDLRGVDFGTGEGCLATQNNLLNKAEPSMGANYTVLPSSPATSLSQSNGKDQWFNRGGENSANNKLFTNFI